MRFSTISWNAVGLGFPLVVALLTVPVLARIIGDERFGLLALCWGFTALGGVMDLGIGRALTRVIAVQRGKKRYASVPSLVATSIRLTMIFGLIGGLFLAISAAFVDSNLLNAATVSSEEIRLSLLLLAITLPVQSLGAVFRGVNEAFMNFRAISIVRIFLGIINFAGPLLVAAFTSSLPWLVLSLTVSRVAAAFLFWSLSKDCVRQLGGSMRTARYRRGLALSLISFGGWLTVSNVLSPIMLQLDRFVIAVMMSAAAVTVYVLPFELVIRCLVLVGAVTAVLFPTLGMLMQERPDDWQRSFGRWRLIMMSVMSVFCSVLAYVFPYVFVIWIGDNADLRSIKVGQVLCLGIFLNSLGSMYFALLHAKGRADLTAKLHLIEFPFFLLVLVGGIQWMGVVGAAWAWVIRVGLDAALLTYFGQRECKSSTGLRGSVGHNQHVCR